MRTEYDNLGSMTKQSIVYMGLGRGMEMYYWYEYDDEGRLKRALSSVHDAITTAREDVVYLYDKAGQDSLVLYPSLPGPKKVHEYSYDTRGRLEQLHVQDAYTQTLGYYQNGNVKNSNTSLWTPGGNWVTQFG